jgi:hypothetical protein
MCTVLLPPGDNPVAVNKYIINKTLCRITLDEGSVRRRGLYMTRRRNQSRQISVTPARIEPAIPPNERRQTQALDHATAGTGRKITSMNILQTDKMRSDKCGWDGDV